MESRVGLGSWLYTEMVYLSEDSHLLARDAQAKKLALIVAHCLSINLSICVSVRDSLSHAYARSLARREPRRLPACLGTNRARRRATIR